MSTRLFAVGADVIDRIAAKAPRWRVEAAACATLLSQAAGREPDLRLSAACLKEALGRDDAEGVARALRVFAEDAAQHAAEQGRTPHASVE